MNVRLRWTVGENLLTQTPPDIFVFLSSFFFFLNVPPYERHKGKQWILRTCRKAGISWTDPCFCRASPPHPGGGEEEEEEYGKVSCTPQWLLSSPHTLIPLVQGFLSVRGLEGLDLRFLILYVSQLHVITRKEGKLYSDNTSICNWHCPGNQWQDSRCYH